MKLIDGDTLKSHNAYSQEHHELVMPVVYIDWAPEVDPVKHGHWEIIEYDLFTCSECGESYYNGCDSTKEAKECLKLHIGRVYEYCPFCGARMDEDAADSYTIL